MRIVVKIGTHLLTTEKGVNEDLISNLSEDIYYQIQNKNEFIIVTSGAIGAGVKEIGLQKRPTSLILKQATSSVGQVQIMKIYEKYFKQKKINVAQILLTHDDFQIRQRYINIRNTIFSLLKFKCIPIINENDTVSTQEIEFGDNDLLSALVAVKTDSDLLIILTDVDGFFIDKNLIRDVFDITNDIENYAKKTTGDNLAKGGMYSKIQAAKIALKGGLKTVIANGNTKEIINKIIKNDFIGTTFYPKLTSLTAKEKWIAFSARVKGRIYIDDGAVDAIVNRKKSLLPSGIKRIQNKFSKGDVVSIFTLNEKEIAKGITYYSSDEIEKIMGRRSSEIFNILPQARYEEVIHRDNLLLIS